MGLCGLGFLYGGYRVFGGFIGLVGRVRKWVIEIMVMVGSNMVKERGVIF